MELDFFFYTGFFFFTLKEFLEDLHTLLRDQKKKKKKEG